MNFIQKYNLTRQLSRFVKRKKREEVQVCSLEQAKSVCILHSFESQEFMQQIIKLGSSLEKNKKNVAFFCYLPKEKEFLASNHERVGVISEKDFDFKGCLRKEKSVSLQKQSFDILLDLDKTKDSLSALYLAVAVNAKFRIGRCENVKKYYNVILYSSNESCTLEEYFQSVDKYTKKIVRQ